MTSFSNLKKSLPHFPRTIGFIGASRIAMKHRLCLTDLAPNTEIIFLSQYESPRREKESNLRFTDNLDEFMAASPHWVVIATAAAKHHHYINEITQTAEAVLIEKPIAANSEQARHIIEAQQKNNCPILVGYNLRFLEGLQQLRKALCNGILGQLYNVQITVGQNLEQWRPTRNVGDTVSAQKALGGGVLRELSHELDLMHLLFGKPISSSMMSTSAKFSHFDVEDTAFILSEYGPGHYSPTSFIASINMDFVRRDATRKIELIGERGTLIYDINRGVLTFKNEEKYDEICTIHNDVALSYRRMWAALASKEFNRFCTVKEALSTLTLIEKLENKIL